MEFDGQISRLLWVVMLVLVNGWWHSCYGCWEQEKIALLQLKASINHPNGISLPSWVEGKESSDCCRWKRVECNITTGRVIQLSLNSTRVYQRSGECYLNASMFLPFEELRGLYLGGNYLVGWFENDGSERLSSRLSNLEVLDLSANWFNNSILSFLSGFSSLKSLYLVRNVLKGPIHIEGSERLASRLSNLEVLDLSWNNLNNSILSTLGGLSSLKSLHLRGTQLKGSIHIKELDALSNLKELDMSHNEIESCVTPEGIKSLSKLKVLHLDKTLYFRDTDYKGTISAQSSERLLSRLSINLEVLDLSFNRFNNNILSSLSGFSSLKSLNLAHNRLKGSIHIEGSETLSSWLSNLEVLDLSFNHLNNSILSSLSGLPSLKYLNLEYNQLKGSIHIKDLEALTNLEELDLRGNKIDSFVTPEGIKSLSKLKVLYLDYSSLNKSFLQSIGVMTSLKVLSLSNCGLNGTLPAQGLCELKNLQQLDLSGNEFEGRLPSCLGNLTSLRLLDLSYNQFTGNIASSPLTSLTLLEYLSLSNNHFRLPVSFGSFANHSSLKVILGDNNILVEPTFQTWVPKFQLKVFTLSKCTFDELIVAPPNFLYYQYDLRVVDLSHSNLGGKFTAWLLENNTRLDELHLRNNSFIGPFELPSHPNSNIYTVDVSNNNIRDQIPTNISLIFPNLRLLNISRNAFEGNIPSCFGDMKSLVTLDLSNNQLSGGVPEHLAMGCFSLNFFKLSNNRLRGQIFPTFFNLTSLSYLYLDGNKFEGKIPNISSAIFLIVLDISNNTFSGELPRWIGNMSNLVEIAMSKNHLEGPIPVEFCKLDGLEFLDLSENNLSGFISPCSSPLKIGYVHLNKNRLRGPIKRGLFYSYSLVTLDLGDNNLIGSIPNWIGSLSELSILILKANHLEGSIPIQLCHLNQLSIIDLSRNNLSGTIPRCLSNITFEATIEKSIERNSGIDTTFSMELSFSYVEGSKLTASNEYRGLGYPLLDVRVDVEFTTKSRSYSYEGDILNFMSGIDLSCNQLSGEIPLEIGNLSNIRALNLSHNNLTGSIPTTFSKLRQTESLDVSYNNLNGRIPSQLTELTSLSFFTVAHNNLSGQTLERINQFATFEESSYEANPLLCGPPLHNNCTKPGSPSPTEKASDLEGEDSGFIDKDIFCVSFVASYIIVLFGIAAVLYINPYWRRAWFYLIELCATSCYYYVLDNFPKLSIFRNM